MMKVMQEVIPLFYAESANQNPFQSVQPFCYVDFNTQKIIFSICFFSTFAHLMRLGILKNKTDDS